MKLFFVIAIFLVIFGSAQSTPVNSADSDWKWIDWNSKSENIPENSVQGGVNPQGRPLYVARVPGAAVEDEREFVYGSCGATDGKSDDDCFFSNDTEEKKVHDVQILVGENFSWCPGAERTASDLICRASLHPGRFEVGTLLSNGKCRRGFEDGGVSGVAFQDEFEVLRHGSC